MGNLFLLAIYGTFVLLVAIQAWLGLGLSTFGYRLESIIGAVLFIGAIFGAVLLSARRWHDMNQTGALAILMLVPGVNLICFILQLVIAGTPGPNKYGVLPSSAHSLKDIFGIMR